jgi:hypothetical protein
MAFVAPLAVAAGASAAAATWISVGVSVAFLVGSWLFAASNRQKNEVFDPGAQEMPRFNQALRGATMPVYFGTNRCPSHVVWTNDFTTIRKETDSGGGGKFGGSGFGSKTPSGGGEVTYEYKWDLMFHIGMVPEPYGLLGGWLGSKRLNSDTILAISQGGENSGLLFLGDERPSNASLSFSEGFYSPGVTTGDDSFTAWTHFTNEVGQEHWFPSTAYVGFKQLSLGGQPAIPQLNWEIGPGDIALTYETNFLHKAALNENNHIQNHSILGDDNVRYYVANNRVYKVSDGTIIYTFDADTIATAAETLIGGGATFNSPSFGGLTPVQGSNYLIANTRSFTGTSGMVWVLLKVNSSGTVEAVGAYFSAGGSGRLVDRFYSAGLAGQQTDDDPILALYISGSGSEVTYLAICPSPNTMINSPTAELGSNRTNDVVALMTQLGEDFGECGTYAGWGVTSWVTGWFLPFGLNSTRLYVFVPKAVCQAHIDNFGTPQSIEIDALAPTYPDGFIAYIDLGGVVFPDTSSTFAPSSDLTIANDDVEAFPFPDAWKTLDGDTSSNSDYYPAPTVTKLTDIALIPVWVVIFAKKSEDNTDESPVGTYLKVVVYIYNQLTGEFTRYTSLDGSTFDPVVDGGVAENRRFETSTEAIMAFYFPESEKIVEARQTTSLDAALDDKILLSEFANFEISGGGDVLPPYIIYQILTNPVFGLGYSTDTIDTDSYNSALVFCDEEGIRVSTAYHREEGALRIIELLLSLYGGYLVISGGKIKFGRQQVVTAVRTIDNHHLVREGDDPPVKITRGALQDAPNKVKVNYIDRAIEYRQNFVEVEDPVDIDLHGVRAREFPPQFIMSEATARKLANRALWSGLYARDQYSFTLGLKDSDLEPGDVITLQDSFHAELASGVYCRLTKMRETKPGRYEWVGVTEYTQYNASSLAANSATTINSNVLFGPAKPPLDFRMFELPKEFQTSDPRLYVGWVPGNLAMGARLYASPDNVTFGVVQDVQPYIIAGRLQSDLSSHEGIDQSVEVYLFPTSGFNASSPTFTMTHALDDVSQAGRAIGTGLMWVGSEMMAYQGVNLISQNRYRFDKVYRGWGGTYVHAHSVGDYWWKFGGGVFAQNYNEDKIGTIIYYKVVPYNFSGVEYNVSSIDAKSYQILGTYYRPQNCPTLHTFLNTPTLGTGSDDLRGFDKVGITSGGSDIRFDWSDASRMEGWGQGGYGQSTYGHFATDTTSHSWRVEVLSSNAAVVRSVSVSTHYYEYGREVNSADFNGWTGNFIVKVTPYNNYGDALISGVKSLNLFQV